MSDWLPPILPTDDFWSRRANAQTHAFECAPYGIPARITANQADVLEAARLSARRYSRAEAIAGRPIRIHIAVDSGDSPPLPDDLSARLKYTGVGEWITLSAGEWGHAFANLDTRTAVIALSPALAADTRTVSRYFIDHYVLNFVFGEWAMLHASCVLDAQRRRLIVMVATHNAGKSTTALRLARAGYAFLADGMAVMQAREGQLVFGGYPLGEVKLRGDVLGWFPEYDGEAVRVREQHKTIVDMRAAHPGRVVESLVAPRSIHLCFVERAATLDTRIEPMSVAEAIPLLAANTVYWDDPARLEHNSATLHHLLRVAHLHRVRLGSDPDRLADAFNQLSN
jgi:hypothetical protein